MYAFNILTEHRIRYIFTALGIALCTLLMLFLISIYQGVSYGSTEYVRSCNADLWILQKHATNILRSTSILPASYEDDLNKIRGVKSASPVIFILAAVKLNNTNATLYLAGFDPVTGIGGPPEIIQGRNIRTDDEIVLDKSFAAKYNIKIGDKVPIREDSLKVTGISTGTNMFVIQYAFISIDEAHKIIGFWNIVSCYQVHLIPGFRPEEVKSNIYSSLRKISVLDKETFLKNNIQEMENGIVPLLFIITLISGIVLTAILSLILSISVMEKRKDFAIIKAIGSPRGFISGIIIQLSILLSLTGLAFALMLFFPMIALVEKISPEVSARTSIIQILFVSLAVIVISLISSILPNQKIRKIYPLEVFK